MLAVIIFSFEKYNLLFREEFVMSFASFVDLPLDEQIARAFSLRRRRLCSSRIRG
jgi:hypothetical protein